MKKIAAVLFAFIAFTLSLSAQRISVLGDSYSTYAGHVQPANNRVWYKVPCDTSRTDVDSVDQLWWNILASRNGWTVERNNSYSGATVCNTGYDAKDYADRSFVTRMYNLGNPDKIFILGATNDSWAGSPIGEYKYGEWTAEDLRTFRPAMACMLANMKQLYPAAEIYFVLNCNLSDDIDNSVTTVCGHYGVPVVELEDIDCKRGHPTRKGMVQIADQIGGVLQ